MDLLPVIQDPMLRGLLVLILGLFADYFVFKAVKKAFVLLANSFIGLVLLVMLHYLPFIKIPITFWAVLITLFGGLLGLVAVVILQLLGISL